MITDSFFAVSRYAGLVVDLLIVGGVLLRGQAARWPSLLAYSCGSMAVDLGLTFSGERTWTHYYLYWGWIGAAALLRVWIVSDVVNSLPGSRILSSRVRSSSASFAFAVSLLAWWISSSDIRAHHSTFRSTAALLDVALNYSWLAGFVVLFGTLWWKRLSWSRRSALVGAGLTLKGCGALICSYLIASGSPDVRARAMTFNAIVSFIAISLWACAFAVPEAIYENSLPQSQSSEKAEPLCTS